MNIPALELSSLDTIGYIKHYNELIQKEDTPLEIKFYSAIREIEKIHVTDRKQEISFDLSCYFRTCDQSQALGKEVKKFLDKGQLMINLVELRQELVHNIHIHLKVSKACFKSLKKLVKRSRNFVK